MDSVSKLYNDDAWSWFLSWTSQQFNSAKRAKKIFARSHTCIYKELNPKSPIFPILNQIPNLILKNQRKFRASCLPIEKAHEMLGNISDY